MNVQYDELMKQIIQAEYDFNNALANAFKPFVDAAQSAISVGDEVYYNTEKLSKPSDKMIVIKDYGETCRAYSISRMTSFTFEKINLCKTGKRYESIPFPEGDEGEEE